MGLSGETVVSELLKSDRLWWLKNKVCDKLSSVNRRVKATSDGPTTVACFPPSAAAAAESRHGIFNVRRGRNTAAATVANQIDPDWTRSEEAPRLGILPMSGCRVQLTAVSS